MMGNFVFLENYYVLTKKHMSLISVQKLTVMKKVYIDA